jgi:hypothetical protein
MPKPKVQRRSQTSWRAKLHKPMLPKPVPVPDGVMRRLGHRVILISTLTEVDTTIRQDSTRRGERTWKGREGKDVRASGVTPQVVCL